MGIMRQLGMALARTPRPAVANDYDRELAARALPHLSELDRHILTGAYGLDGRAPVGDAELAAELAIAPAELGWRQMSALLVADSDRRRTRCMA